MGAGAPRNDTDGDRIAATAGDTLRQMNLEPEELRREIDETLEELERLEAEVMAFFAELGGEEAARQVEAFKVGQERQPRIVPLRPASGETANETS